MSSESPLSSLHGLVWIALMAALMAAGAYMSIPVAAVPFSLQTMFVLLAGYLLGPVRGAVAVGLYLAAGLIGLPVFSGGRSGLAHLLGPTGGFLFGFLVLAYLAGMARQKGSAAIGWGRGAAFGGAGLALMYCLGAVWLKLSLDMGWAKAVMVSAVPFLPGSGLKLFLAIACARYLGKRMLAPS
ncbi:MAG: biotin transporter BioY [Desulfovibrionaceae bacterium]|nr:biotin transporter BioY [Desulfovibrionaceae bacterium]MDD4951673.1 biotin transporter BioY [Desulfovibrionaceae bacterium]